MSRDFGVTDGHSLYSLHRYRSDVRHMVIFNVNVSLPKFYDLLEVHNMAFFNSAIEVLQTLVVALGAGLGVWGAINLMEGYGNDNPGANAHVR